VPSSCGRRRSRHLRILFLQHRHRRLADADLPMFQQAPMLPIFDVRCVHWPNSSACVYVYARVCMYICPCVCVLCCQSQDEETASNCSSRSRHSEQTKYRPSTTTSNSGAGMKPVTSSTPVPRSFHTEHDDNLADLEFTADEIVAGSRNPLLLLSAAARQLNPRQFDLPKDVSCPVNFPGELFLSLC